MKKLIPMGKWKLTPKHRRVLFVILWTILAVVGFVLEEKRVWALVLYLFQISFVFIDEAMRRRRQGEDRRFFSYMMDDLFLWLFPISRIIIVFMQ